MNGRYFIKYIGIIAILLLIANLCFADANSLATRTITFPEDSVGYISLYEGYYHSGANYLTKAQGKIEIPAGKKVKLTCSTDLTSLDFLQNVGPNDLDTISLQSCNKIPTESYSNLGHLAGLESINLWNVENTDLSFLKNFTSLYGIFLNSGHKQLNYLKHISFDSQIWLDNSGLDDSDFLEIIQSNKIKFLLMRDNHIAFKFNEKIELPSNLKSLALCNNLIDDNGISYISSDTLKSLALNDNFLTDKAVEHIVKSFPNLETLEIGNVKTKNVLITNKSLALISNLKSLESLNISGNSIRGDSLKNLPDSLKAIYASDTDLENKDIFLLPRSLKYISLNGTNINNDCLSALKDNKISSFDVRGTDITLDGLKTIKESFAGEDEFILLSAFSKQNYPAPDFHAKTIQNPGKDSISLDDLKDKITIMTFFGAHCGFCKYPIRDINKIHKQAGDLPIEFLFVTRDSKEEISEYLKETPADGIVAVDAQQIFTDYNIKGIPQIFIIGPDKKIITSLGRDNIDFWRFQEAVKGNYKPLISQQADIGNSIELSDLDK